MTKFSPAALLAAALVQGSALACGYCVEDKVASAYDHSVVTGALAQKHHVVFFHLEGALGAGEAARRAVRDAVEAIPGVDRASARAVPDTLTLSFAYDPRRLTVPALQSALDKRLARLGLAAFPLRAIERPGDLAALKR